MKVASISISIGIVILASMVAFSAADGCCRTGDVCSPADSNCKQDNIDTCGSVSRVCCDEFELCAPPGPPPPPPGPPPAPAPAPVEITPYVPPFTEQSFTTEEAPALVFDKQQELSAANGLRNFATIQGDLFVDPTISANNAINTAVTNNAAFGTPAVQFPTFP
jgi:hypothetical protein